MLGIKLRSWPARLNRSFLGKKTRLLGLTTLELLIMLMMISVTVGTAFAIHQHRSVPVSTPEVSNTTSSPLEPYTAAPAQNTKPSTSQESPAAQPTTPVYGCTDSGKATLNQAYKNADAAFANTTQVILSNTDLTDVQAVDQLNQAILAVDGQYVVAYGQYVAGQHANGCSAPTSARASLPLCHPATLNSLSVINCVANIHLED